jgi:hypothetical protein
MRCWPVPLLASIWGVLLVTIPHAQEPDYSLDLVDSPRSTDQQYLSVTYAERLEASSMLTGVRASENPVSTLPVQVSILSATPTVAAVGEEITCELLIVNGGADTLLVPTATEIHRFTRMMQGATAARFSLMFADEVLGEQQFGGEATYGSAAVSNSLLVLDPGRSLKVRIKQRHSVQPVEGAPDEWLRTVQLKAVFSLFRVNGTPYPPVVSNNHIAVDAMSNR